jgi:formamidopyrimidine-DNA glycosylase
LYHALRTVLALSIEKGGSTDRNYVDAEGKRGSYLTFANVFRREGKPCPRCGTTIIKTRVAGRGTHLCPHCQLSPAMVK